MEISLYKFLFAISLIIFAITILYIKDANIKIIFTLISFIFFAALALQSLNIELYVYDGTAWQTQRVEDYYLPLGINFILTIITGINFLDLLLELFQKPFAKQPNQNKYSRKNRSY